MKPDPEEHMSSCDGAVGQSERLLRAGADLGIASGLYLKYRSESDLNASHHEEITFYSIRGALNWKSQHKCLKRSYDAISSFPLSLECFTAL